MAAFLGFAGMIAMDALLIFIASNKKARFLLWKLNLSNLLSKKKDPKEADEIYLTVVPLIMGIFLVGSSLVFVLCWLK